MFFRMISLVLTLGITGYLLMMALKSDKEIDKNPTVIEQKKVLLDATGVDASDPKAVKDYTLKQAQEIEAFQKQAEQVGTGE